MTEDEAKTKWCPFSRTGLHAGAGGVSVNRSVGDGTDGPFDVIKVTRCFASACMAWRRIPDTRTSIPVRVNEAGREEFIPPPGGFTGYCGLAGKP